ncbi:leupaxin isoform X1 [Eucyclogobius newberryi]|uniref:leupaxin isoform X1 n=1 Tax=Eucyclogobius newberryi TaxID=166745 RepID=UPI003B5AEBD9
MDELDLLLEELALGSKDNIPTENFGEPTENVNASSCSNVYSSLPAPVAATNRDISPTKELESILEDLLGLADQHQEPKESPPPLAKKLSLKKREETIHEENRDVQPALSKKTDTIDELLGGLSSDLEKIGVKTTAKGHCAACQKIIVGKIITALGETWHPEHFVCVMCKMELSAVGFFERDGRPYCSKDYHELFSPRCAYCKGPILQNILNALDQTWHPEHFFCSHCGDLFGSEGFLEKEGKPYCCEDFYNLFAPKCSGCGGVVRENYLTAANGTWHPECFVCADCLIPFSGGHFLELEGRFLCPLHFHSRQGTLCGSCGEPITGRCISALSRKFHPEHFVCAFCLRQLSQGIFKDQKGKPYCNGCFNKLFV